MAVVVVVANFLVVDGQDRGEDYYYTQGLNWAKTFFGLETEKRVEREAEKSGLTQPRGSGNLESCNVCRLIYWLYHPSK